MDGIGRRISGTTVIGGMLAASLIGIFFVPAVFYVVERLSGAGKEVAAKATLRKAVPAEGD